jgi:cell division protease FtsH
VAKFFRAFMPWICAGICAALAAALLAFAWRSTHAMPLFGPLAWALVPLALLPAVAVYLLSVRRARPLALGGPNRARVRDRRCDETSTFADVAGVDEAKAELVEIVRFLKEPARYTAIGARVPKGVLLVGPPGTGKTLLARAVAGEANVPFFAMSGSAFVEMFVGVGASRVRDLFGQARDRAPCIVFIDELDAVGRSRGAQSSFGGNEEREQTLNQLLVEMDGDDATRGSRGVIVMAATNRPEVLDRALLRPGRFDREVIVDRPDVRGREAILHVHARRVRLAPDVDVRFIAQRTPGMVGADLANVVNEAALASVRRDSDVVAAQDFEAAIDRIQLGLPRDGRLLSERERRRVALHESGHALVALSVEHADPVHRVTIVPRSIGALGATLQLPRDDRYMLTKDELTDRICTLLGGRVAEEIACGGVSTGAEDDLERATDIARQMVCRFGMSDRLGVATFARPSQTRFLSLPDASEPRGCSEETSRAIDAEIAAILSAEHARARRFVERQRRALDAIAAALLANETVDHDELHAIVDGGHTRCDLGD